MTEWLKKFRWGCKNLYDQEISGRPKTVNSKTVLQAIEASSASSTRGVSAELRILQTNVVHHLHDLSKSIQSCRIMLHIEILQNFWFATPSPINFTTTTPIKQNTFTVQKETSIISLQSINLKTILFPLIFIQYLTFHSSYSIFFTVSNFSFLFADFFGF